MGLFSRIFGKGEDLRSYLDQTKKVRIDGVVFKIKKIDVSNHLEGLKVILRLSELYKREKPADKTAIVEDNAKLQKFMRDFIFAGVVHPKLTIKDPPEEGAIPVSDITARIDLAQKLCVAIIRHAYGKKN